MGSQPAQHLVFLTALVLATGACVVPAQKTAQLAELQLGDHWFGAGVTHDDLRGKVVLVEYWGS